MNRIKMIKMRRNSSRSTLSILLVAILIFSVTSVMFSFVFAVPTIGTNVDVTNSDPYIQNEPNIAVNPLD